MPGEDGAPYLVTKEEIRETMDYISRYSLYAYETELRQGFLTIEGGHRIGVSGKVIVEGNKIKNMQYISSVNIRAAHEVIGCAESGDAVHNKEQGSVSYADHFSAVLR